MDTTTPQISDPGVHFAAEPLVTVFGVKYLHLRMDDGSDLYVTEHGLPFTKCLLPKNHWADPTWRNANRVRLLGSSSVFRMTTKQIEGRSKEIVLKWNRMGQDIPGETAAAELAGAEFNSPFMEFSLVVEMRESRNDSNVRLRTHKPLAIYVPRRFVEGELLGRRRDRMEAIEQTHEEISIDWNRTYAVIYEWIKGLDASKAYGDGLIDHSTMIALFHQAANDLKEQGFHVRDNKPRHIIVRPNSNGEVAKDAAGQIAYGLVDFELLERTPEREEALRAKKRRDYLARQARRFEEQEPCPPGISRTSVMGVDYIFGEVEATGGALWVVGRDPVLFDYFLPEKWRRTPRTKIGGAPRAFETVTKDNVHLVWRVARVGERPDVDPFVRSERRILRHGYNSPFEEVAIAMELSRKGIETKYPRAIYMAGRRTAAAPALADDSRYKSHADLRTSAGRPILSEHHDYIIIWGFWNGPDEVLAVKDEVLYERVDALGAYRSGRLSQRAYLRVMRKTKKRLVAAGVEDLSLRGDHLLLSVDRNNKLATDENDLPLVRISNFELLKRIGKGK